MNTQPAVPYMTEQKFKKQYKAKLKIVSPDQPERWYNYQTEVAWENHKKSMNRLYKPINL